MYCQCSCLQYVITCTNFYTIYSCTCNNYIHIKTEFTERRIHTQSPTKTKINAFYEHVYYWFSYVSQEKKYMTKSYHITFSFHIFSDLDYVPFENKCIVLLQTVLEWSHEKYAAVFNSYSDNIAGRSFRSR